MLESGEIIDDDVAIISAMEWEKASIEFVAVAKLHDHYLYWCRKHGERYPEKKRPFGKALRELLPEEWSRRTESRRGFDFPRIKKCRRVWEQKLKK